MKLLRKTAEFGGKVTILTADGVLETPLAVAEVGLRGAQLGFVCLGIGSLKAADGCAYAGNRVHAARARVGQKANQGFQALREWGNGPAPVKAEPEAKAKAKGKGKKKKAEAKGKKKAEPKADPCPHCGRVLQRKREQHIKACGEKIAAAKGQAESLMNEGLDLNAAARRAANSVASTKEARSATAKAVVNILKRELEEALNGGGVLDPGPA